MLTNGRSDERGHAMMIGLWPRHPQTRTVVDGPYSDFWAVNEHYTNFSSEDNFDSLHHHHVRGASLNLAIRSGRNRASTR
jgi:hypothetical protein